MIINVIVGVGCDFVFVVNDVVLHKRFNLKLVTG